MDRLKGTEAVAVGHANVEQYDIGPMLLGQLDRLLATAGLRHNLDVCIGQQAGQTGADHLVVVRQQESDTHRISPPRSAGCHTNVLL